MRDRERILRSLETVYQEAFDAAEGRGDREAMGRLDFEYQRDQLWFEVLLDVRGLLSPPPAEQEGSPVDGILDKARALRRITGR